MTKDEFIERAREYGYLDEDIEELIDMIDEANGNGVHMTFDYVAENVLAEQPTY